MSHKRNKNWTIKVESSGTTFFITDIPFQDIALACEKGIKENIVFVKTKVFYAKP